jgi:hypothetical protein
MAPRRSIRGEAIRAGRALGPSVRDPAEANTRVRRLLVERGHGSLYSPHLHLAAIWRELDRLAPTIDAKTDDGRAVRRVLARTPAAHRQWLSRHAKANGAARAPL